MSATFLLFGLFFVPNVARRMLFFDMLRRSGVRFAVVAFGVMPVCARMHFADAGCVEVRALTVVYESYESYKVEGENEEIDQAWSALDLGLGS